MLRDLSAAQFGRCAPYLARKYGVAVYEVADNNCLSVSAMLEILLDEVDEVNFRLPKYLILHVGDHYLDSLSVDKKTAIEQLVSICGLSQKLVRVKREELAIHGVETRSKYTGTVWSRIIARFVEVAAKPRVTSKMQRFLQASVKQIPEEAFAQEESHNPTAVRNNGEAINAKVAARNARNGIGCVKHNGIGPGWLLYNKGLLTGQAGQVFWRNVNHFIWEIENPEEARRRGRLQRELQLSEFGDQRVDPYLDKNCREKMGLENLPVLIPLEPLEDGEIQ